jgi:ankyrin repeat protein
MRTEGIVHASDNEVGSPLCLAAIRSRNHSLQLLPTRIEKETIDDVGQRIGTALHAACYGINAEGLDILLRHSTSDVLGRQAQIYQVSLTTAICDKNVDCSPYALPLLSRTLQKSADADECVVIESDALCLAVYRNNGQLVKSLLRAKASPNGTATM